MSKDSAKPKIKIVKPLSPQIFVCSFCKAKQRFKKIKQHWKTVKETDLKSQFYLKSR